MIDTMQSGPTIPENFQEFALTHSTISFIWDKAIAPNGLSAYHIYQDGVRIGSSCLTEYNTVKTNYTVTGLAPDTVYRFAVLAEDLEGHTSPLSPYREVKTKQAGTVFDVKDYGAAGDGVQKDTVALQGAIAACTAGGIVRVPAGIYLTAPLSLKSDMTLLLDKGAILKGSRQREEYPVIMSRWEGLTFPSYQSLITAENAHNLVIMGEGVLDGNAGPGPDGQNCWWDKPKAYDPQHEIARPRTLQLIHCQHVTVQGITVTNSPSWTIHPLYSKDLIFVDVTVHNAEGGPNTDGFDPDSVENLLLVNMVFNVGDDCIAIKSGKDAEARTIGIPTNHVIIRNCVMRHGHGGISIGSEMSGGIKNIIVKDCVFDGTDIGVRIKTLRGRGGVIENLTFDSIVMKNIVNDAFNINTDYAMNGTPVRPGPVTEETPVIRNLTFHNIKVSGAKEASYFKGLDEMHIEGLVFSDIEIHAEKGLYAKNVSKVKMKDVSINNGQMFQPSCSITELAHAQTVPSMGCSQKSCKLPQGVLACAEGTITLEVALGAQAGAPLLWASKADGSDVLCVTVSAAGCLVCFREVQGEKTQMVGEAFERETGYHQVVLSWQQEKHMLWVDGTEILHQDLVAGACGDVFDSVMLGQREEKPDLQDTYKQAAIYNYVLTPDEAKGCRFSDLTQGGTIITAGLYVGSKQYSDKSEAFSFVPTFLAGCDYIQTRQLSQEGLRIYLTRPSTLYVAYDDSAELLPSWLEAFQSTESFLHNTANRVFRLYQRSCEAGEVFFGDNGQGLGMYTVLVGPLLTPPQAKSVTLVVPVAVGVDVKGSYVYEDSGQQAEEGSVYQWYTATERDGTYMPLPGANALCYQPERQQLHTWLKFSVLPKNKWQIGTETFSAPFEIKVYEPRITISSPLNGDTVTGKVDVTTEVESDFPIDKVELYGNGVLLAVQPASVGEGRYVLSFHAGDVAAGQLSLLAKAYNRYQGIGTSPEVQLTVHAGTRLIKTPQSDFYINKFSVHSHYGSSKTLDVRADRRKLDVWYADSIAYLTFSLEGVDTGISYASMSLYGAFAQRQTGAGYANDGIFIHQETLPADSFCAYGLLDTSLVYDEKKATYALMQQDNIGEKLSSTMVFELAKRYEWDVTAAVAKALANHQDQVTLALWSDHDTDGNFLCSSRKEEGQTADGKDKVPHLKIYYQD